MVVIVMGVSGAGKSTIGRRLGDALGWEFVEGDAFHPSGNIRKLSHAVPLTDEDRDPWLQTLRRLIDDWLRNDKNVVLACSALKARHREHLLADPNRMRIVYLKGPPSLLRGRLLRRRKHFMAPELLQSQLDTLEEPAPGMFPPAGTIVDIGDAPEVMIGKIREALRL
jgi:gluconokinase